MKNRIVITGGGSGGHTIPALVMIKYWKSLGMSDLYYVGSAKGIERQIVTNFVRQYFPISTGKLRRYISLENFLDLFKFIYGIFQSLGVLFSLKPSAVFSTGGFVALPVVIAAKLLRIRVVIHEQTTHVGLANKLSSYFADAICISFKTSAHYFPAPKTTFTGYPLRAEFYAPIEKLSYFQSREIRKDKKILLILGGGNGSVLLNNFVKNHAEYLCQEFVVILQAGDKYEQEFKIIQNEDFWVFSFLQEEMVRLIATADYIVARSGAGTVCELIHLQKKCLFVPLAIAQKNEQWHNAQAAKDAIGSAVLSEEQWKVASVDDIIKLLYSIEVKVQQVSVLPTASAATLIHAQVCNS